MQPLLPPFPGPSSSSKNFGQDSKILSPGDSVFSRDDSVSSDDYKSATERSPSPEGIVVKIASAPIPPDHLSEEGRGDEGVKGEEVVEGGGEHETDTTRRCGSPQNTFKISEFHKSLSDLAHSFSTLLISEDEQNVLKSAE